MGSVLCFYGAMETAPSYVDDTIVARATPAGAGGVAIVRLSGPEACAIATKMLGDLPAPRLAAVKTFRDVSGDAIDTGMALYFPAPRSFTGEQVVELHAHGGPVIVAALVDAAVALGARHAEPGEFSQRAYVNGKLDLLQAEAVADLIGSGTAEAARAALRSLSGEFSQAVHELAEALTQLRLYVEAAIDFPEEEIDFLSDERLTQRVDACAKRLAEMLEKAEAGRLLRDGYQVAIVGPPNAGKSSLLNRLSGQDAAIVTEWAGTTRDVLRESVNLDGLQVEFVDTAGLREDPDRIEAEGIRRARAVLDAADAALWVEDATQSPQELPDELPDALPIRIVRNKIDLTGGPAGIDGTRDDVVNVSAKTGKGLDALKTAIKGLAGYQTATAGTFSARRRHLDALARASRHFESGVAALREARAGELLAEELKEAQRALGEITGEVSSDELLGRIFSEFCIGK